MAFPGCDSCYRVGSLETNNVVGIRVIDNPLSPLVEEGVYMCKYCGSSTTFYDHVNLECKECSKQMTGCSECSSDGSLCTKCRKWYTLTKDDRCLSCTTFDSRCDRCSTSRCLDCIPDWSVVDGGQACWFNPFSLF